MTLQMDNATLSHIISGRTQELDLDSVSPEEWSLLVRKAQAEGVAPLVYWAFSAAGNILSLPKAAQNSLRAMYFSTRMHNEQMLSELETLAGSFARADIPTVALKGICYALTIYADIGLRPMVDLDLLVPASRVSTAVWIARSSGYVVAMPEASHGLDDLLNHAVCLKKTTAPFTTLELHTTLVAEGSYRHAVPVDWFWSQTERMDGISPVRRLDPLLMLTPTAQVLYACAHAMLQHGGRNTSLRWLYDLDRLLCVYTERLDWDLLVSQARTFAWGSAVSAALSQAVLLFDSPVPQTVLDDLSTESDRNTERVHVMQRPPATHTLEEYQKIKSLNWQGRIRLILALAIPSPAYMRWRYGLRSGWALPGWYLLRWWGIFVDGVRTVIQLLQKSFMPIRHHD